MLHSGLSVDRSSEPAPEASSRRAGAVRAMFDRIARRYDLANHLLSGGFDFWWRDRAARIVHSWNPHRVLDLATGSGDLALDIKRKLPHAEVTGADFSAEMLAVAERKGVSPTVLADALHLPFADGSFDCLTVAFGLRNMEDWPRALREMARVLASSGHLLVLDFSLPTGWLLPPYQFYLRRCLPTFAAAVTGDRESYDYLGATIEAFPSGANMRRLIEANGFSNATAQALTGGIASIYTAQPLRDGSSELTAS